MKILIPLLFSISFAYAQTYQDAYHSDPRPTCQSESCLISGDIEMGLISYRDIDGFKATKINTSAGLSDVLYKGNDVCFRGASSEAIEILEALAGNEERNYYNGGHQLIERLNLRPSQGSIAYNLKVYSDYGAYELNGEVKKCEN